MNAASKSRKKRPPDDLLLKVYTELTVVHGHQRLMVLVGNGFLELLVNALIQVKLKNGKRISADSKIYSYAVRLVLLHEAGILSDKEFRFLDWFHCIRNRAAHEPLFTLNDEDFAALNNKHYAHAENLSRLITDLVGGLWNAHYELFAPLFGRVSVQHDPAAL